MTRTFLLFAAALCICGCRLPDREATLRALPEGQVYTYSELLARTRAQATTALEAFYVDGWIDLVDAAAALEQSTRFLPKTSDIPARLKDRVGPETDQLRQDAHKLGEAARAKDAQAVNVALQRINARIRELRMDERSPDPAAPPKVNPVP